MSMQLQDSVVSGCLKNWEIVMSTQVILGGENINFLSTYAPQAEKVLFDCMTRKLEGLGASKLVIVGLDLNAHVGQGSGGYSRVYGGFGYAFKNEEGRAIFFVKRTGKY